MKTKLSQCLLAALLSVAFIADLHAQLPNAWQINDISGGSGSLLSYYTNLSAAQFNAATNVGWQFGATCRMISNYGYVGNGSIYLLFGDGTHRYGFNLNLNASGQLVANPLVGATIVLTPNATTATNYHRHEMDFDPATQQVTYSFDGAPLANWSAQIINANKAEPNWGSSSSADRGDINFHHVQFAVTGQGVISTYDAGYAGQPAVAPSPTTQGWSRRQGALGAPEGPVSPDSVASPLVTTLPATAMTPNAASLNASLTLYILPTECYFEYGLTTNYGAFTPTNVIATGGFTASVSEGIGGLLPGTAYHFRAIAANSAGVFASQDLTLTALAFTVVTNLADDGPGTLRSAVALANSNPSGAVIRFDPALSGQTIVLTSGALVLTNNATIDASSLTNGITASGNHNYRIFEIGTNADVLLDSLVLRDGLAPNAAYPAYRGGGILNYGQLTLNNCTLQDNQSVAGDGPAGGGIENYNGTLVISNSLFTGNSVGGPGSNPGSGGGIFNENGTVVINDSIFSSNTPAAIFNSGTLTMNNSTLSDNSAPGDDGGAIYNSFGSVVLNNVTLTGNSAYDGGGIFNSAQLTLNNCTLAGNIASGGPGGGIWSYDSGVGSTVLILNNTVVAGNTAAFDPDVSGSYSGANNLIGGDPLLAPLGDYGGLTPTMPPLPGSPAIDNGHDSVTNSLATDQRGYPRLSGLHVDIGAVESTNLPAAPIVITLPASGQTPTSATLNASVAPNGAMTTSCFEYGLTTAYGSVTASNFLSAGTANISAALTNLSPATYYHYHAVATNSLGTTYGNDVVFHTGGITNMVLNSNDNGPGSLRQAILNSVQGDYPVLFTNTLSGQTILLTNGPIVVGNDVDVDGSALASPVHIDGNQISRVFFVTNATVTLDSLIITHGFEPSHDGGGIENYGTVTLNHSIVAHNSATNGGGGGIGNFGTLTLNHSIVANNSATNLALGYGGGIYNKGALFLNDSTVTNNSALAGIGIYTHGSATLNNSTVAYNAAPIGAGGGIYNEQSGTLTLNNSTVAHNSAPGGYYGGGILTLGTSMLNNSTVAHNSAPGGLGGGIAVASTGTLLLNDCTVTSNSATNGGGIYNASGTVRLTNSIVSANAADMADNIAGGYSGVSNLVNTANINLARLGHYGGPTQTMPPLYGSPAIDAGDDTSASGFAYDQRGYPRLSGAHVDIGAVEAQVASAGNPPVLMSSVWSSGGGSGTTFQFSFTNSANIDFTVLTATNVALPLTNWTILGNAIQVTPGVYQFTDPGATNDPQRFYRVVSP